MKLHLFIIITIVIGFSSFMLGYSLPPFLEVGFGQGEMSAAGQSAPDEADLMQQYQDLYK